MNIIIINFEISKIKMCWVCIKYCLGYFIYESCNFLIFIIISCEVVIMIINIILLKVCNILFRVIYIYNFKYRIVLMVFNEVYCFV